MDQMSYILFICIAAPMLLMFIPIEKHSRKVVLFMLIGMFCCLFVSEVNGLILNKSGADLLYLTTNITPITEEIVKALPILVYALLYSDDRKEIITISFSIGVGFALLENLMILTQHFNTVDLFFAVVRGFCSGLMHSICTVLVGFFIIFVRKRHKIFAAGTISALNFAIVYHAVFNLLVQADSTAAHVVGFLLPISTYALINVFFLKKIRVKKEEN